MLTSTWTPYSLTWATAVFNKQIELAVGLATGSGGTMAAVTAVGSAVVVTMHGVRVGSLCCDSLSCR